MSTDSHKDKPGNLEEGVAGADEQSSEQAMPVEDHTALYRDVRFEGPPKTGWDRLMRFAHRHKRKVYGLLLISLIGSFAVAMRRDEPMSPARIARDHFERFRGQDSKEWVYQIDGASFTTEYLANQYRIIGRYIFGNAGQLNQEKDPAAYKQYLRDQFETDLLVNDAISRGVLDSTEARFIIENAVRHAIADYNVVSRVARPDSDYRVRVTSEEVEAYYEKNKTQYASTGLNKNQTLDVIRRTLVGLKQQEIQTAISVARLQMLDGIKTRGGHQVKDPQSMQ